MPKFERLLDLINLVAEGKVEHRVRLSSLEEIARWVVGFGGGMRVPEPMQLRVQIRRLANDALRQTLAGLA